MTSVSISKKYIFGKLYPKITSESSLGKFSRNAVVACLFKPRPLYFLTGLPSQLTNCLLLYLSVSLHTCQLGTLET